MGAITDLWKSERGLLAVLIIIAATTLTALGHLPVDAWKEMTLYIFGIYAVGKTITSAVSTAKGVTDTNPPVAVAPAAPAAPVAPAAPATPAATP